MSKNIWLLSFVLVVAQSWANKQKIHPIVTASGGVVLTVDINNLKVWSPQGSDVNVIHAAAIHIAAQQCPDGGFGWPHNDCSATFNNITAPILNGIHQAWVQTQNTAYLGIMFNGGNFDLLSQYSNGESRLSTETPLFMWNLSASLSDPAFQDFTDTSFFSELEAGTYGLDDLDTSAWINSVVTVRQGAWINLLPWEFKSLPLIARRHCRSAQSTLFEQAILDSFNTLDNTAPDTVYSDLLGVSDCSRS